MDLTSLYRHRFSEAELLEKNRIWQVLCRDFFSRHVRETDTVVDIGAGYCEFINNIRCGRKIAVDLNPEVRKRADPDVEVINESCTAIASLPEGSADVVFMSNFLEHLPDKALVLETFRETRRLLKPGGKAIILQPNIRFLYAEYWDFFDHHTPLSDHSLVEGLQLAGLEPRTVIPRFLPYTTKSRIPNASWMIRAYLRFPLAWRFMGKQALVIAARPN